MLVGSHVHAASVARRVLSTTSSRTGPPRCNLSTYRVFHLSAPMAMRETEREREREHVFDRVHATCRVGELVRKREEREHLLKRHSQVTSVLFFQFSVGGRVLYSSGGLARVPRVICQTLPHTKHTFSHVDPFEKQKKGPVAVQSSYCTEFFLPGVPLKL